MKKSLLKTSLKVFPFAARNAILCALGLKVFVMGFLTDIIQTNETKFWIIFTCAFLVIDGYMRIRKKRVK